PFRLSPSRQKKQQLPADGGPWRGMERGARMAVIWAERTYSEIQFTTRASLTLKPSSMDGNSERLILLVGHRMEHIGRSIVLHGNGGLRLWPYYRPMRLSATRQSLHL